MPGISDDAHPYFANYEGGGKSYSLQALQSAELMAGQKFSGAAGHHYLRFLHLDDDHQRQNGPERHLTHIRQSRATAYLCRWSQIKERKGSNDTSQMVGACILQEKDGNAEKEGIREKDLRNVLGKMNLPNHAQEVFSLDGAHRLPRERIPVREWFYGTDNV